MSVTVFNTRLSVSFEKGPAIMKFLHRCWCLLLGALLPTACGDNIDAPEYGPAPEYGVPQATVKLDGVVVDVSGAPVRDIVVTMDGFGATASDIQGIWSLNKTGFAACVPDTQLVCSLEATDEDGVENGGPYPPTLVILDLEKTQSGSGNNLGTYEQHDIRIVMDDVIAEYGPECAKAARDRKGVDEG